MALASTVHCRLCGCGPPPPQAPLIDAKKLDASTGAISTTCGESYQLLAFAAGARQDLQSLEVTATAAARKLAAVYARNPAWIYQGETVTEIVHDSASVWLLPVEAAAAALVSATRPFSRSHNGKP